MKIIKSKVITDTVEKMCQEANIYLPCDIKEKLEKAQNDEISPVGKDILSKICDNFNIAKEKEMPICQDTGMAVFFVKIGTEVFVEGNITDAINEGVRRGYVNLRKSVVKDPVLRGNTNDNTPAIIHYEFFDGDYIEITIAPKGFGSENMSAIKMLSPSAGLEGILNFVVETISKAGSNPCPPVIVGVGIGGTFEKCAYLAKKALTRDINVSNENEFYKEMEDTLLKRINNLGIGPQGFGGIITALKVNVETFPTHIAGMPVAVNVGCHVTRHLTKTIS
ncbi:MAG: fumarate hydratase [Ruminococcaceae bacterium]|nr:fumarate hydratase [Oscillospiraceae bacterium]